MRARTATLIPVRAVAARDLAYDAGPDNGLPNPANPQLPSGLDLIEALPLPLIALDDLDCIGMVNGAAEQFLGASAAHLRGRALAEILVGDSPLLTLIHQVRQDGVALSEEACVVESPRFGRREAAVDLAPLANRPGWIAVVLRERLIARGLDRQAQQQGAVRSLNAMAALLAHEIKNPLSGIRGAAQLIEPDLPPGRQMLASLIREEADRIRGLVDRMEMFAQAAPAAFSALNIHEVLDHVRRLGEAGVAAERSIVADYDPSLPSLNGHRDLLVQLFLNLVKNAAEATQPKTGRIRLITRYRQGAKLTRPGGGAAPHLPLAVSIEDNGAGVPEAMQARLFDPFVTSKPTGKGLGLALAAKIVADHGGAIEFESVPGRTVFTVLLPAAPES
ncbi:MAG TPA: ATP-binding protein [Hypericibacter adhaerens]|jgi:two-component system nitrogen regulation sensor histidine kinase GlnL|uniref:histidine kinase n=1 Tax=Hypericibacter adhaerens TaxID=2602016 RepID=A0A5J6MX76_9PROT|nr:ATP-binding protein [Hypericibacter adhaerens]QEX22278.1 PAS domain-containing sensor histidine kinase [Hypericibacter adhaerens]HWA44455.1 ATP-binding protein [Hypericibacter adhaerens]